MTSIGDVAKRAGVSAATVSRYLSGQTIRSSGAVERAIAELGYSPSAIARSLKSGFTRNIGVVIPDITNPFFASVVKGIEEGSRDQSYNLLLCNTDEIADRQDRMLRTLLGLVDALILTPALESVEVPDALRRHAVPVVLLDREFGEELGFDSVLVDNEGGARQAATYLAQIGHERIGVISGPLGTTPGRLRHQGFLAGMEEAHLTVEPGLTVVGDFREIGGYVGMKSLLAATPPTAVFVANNLMAMGALRACKESGVVIPSDLSFVSFDDLELGNLLEPAITTISRSAIGQGALAMSLLAERLSGEAPVEPRKCVLEARLTVRDSCVAVPRLRRVS